MVRVIAPRRSPVDEVLEELLGCGQVVGVYGLGGIVAGSGCGAPLVGAPEGEGVPAAVGAWADLDSGGRVGERVAVDGDGTEANSAGGVDGLSCPFEDVRGCWVTARVAWAPTGPPWR